MPQILTGTAQAKVGGPPDQGVETGMQTPDWTELTPPQFPHTHTGRGVEAEPRTHFHQCTIAGPAQIGFGSYMNQHGAIFPSVTIGRYCSIARRVSIGSSKHPISWLTTHPIAQAPGMRHPDASVPTLETEIGHDVWIGDNAVIVAGVRVGTGSVVGAGAVVTRDVAPYSIVGGVPARLIRDRFPAEVKAAMLELAWWTLHPKHLPGLAWHDIDRCIEQLRALRAQGAEELPPCHLPIS